MNGTITNGWSFVIAAYSVTALFLFGYLVSLIARLRAERSS